MLSEFGFSDCKGIDTPIIQPKLQIKSEKLDSQIPYMEAVGSLNYLATCTRPDISYAVNRASRSMQAPTSEDWVNIKRIFRYLKKTKDFGITYKKGGPNNSPVGYSDASYAPEATDRKSTSGYVFIMNGGAISWKSKRQPIISLSSMEAEYIAITTAAKEGIWIRKLEKDIKGKSDPIKIFEDNQSCIKTAENIIHNDRSKHIDVRYHWIREKVSNQDIMLQYCQTNDMAADMFTKPLGRMLLSRHMKTIGLCSGTSVREDVEGDGIPDVTVNLTYHVECPKSTRGARGSAESAS
jgi:hypothetical protein